MLVDRSVDNNTIKDDNDNETAWKASLVGVRFIHVVLVPGSSLVTKR